MGVASFCKRILQNLKVVDTVSRIDIFANELFSYKLVRHCSGKKYDGPLHTQHSTQYALATLKSFCLIYAYCIGNT